MPSRMVRGGEVTEKVLVAARTCVCVDTGAVTVEVVPLVDAVMVVVRSSGARFMSLDGLSLG